MDFRWFNFRFLRAHALRPLLVHTRGELAFASCVRGYYVCKDRWIPVTNEELACRREPGNVHNPYAVAVTKKLQRYCRPRLAKN